MLWKWFHDIVVYEYFRVDPNTEGKSHVLKEEQTLATFDAIEYSK